MNIECVKNILLTRKELGHLESLYDISTLNLSFEREEVERTCNFLKNCGYLIICQNLSGGFGITITEKGLKYLESILWHKKTPGYSPGIFIL